MRYKNGPFLMVTSAQTSQTVAPPEALPKRKILSLNALFSHTRCIGQTWHPSDHHFPSLSSENGGEPSTPMHRSHGISGMGEVTK